MSKEVKKKKKRKISLQKSFNIISIMFLSACTIFYGIRFVKAYKESHVENKIVYIADTIKDNSISNNNSLTSVNEELYFYGKDVKNYVSYSNFLWRIVKINTDNTVTLALDNSITSLAKGKYKNFKDTNIYTWLNKSDKEYSGILENILNNKEKYLTYTNTCIDDIEDIKKVTCENKVKETYITIPSLNDYINTGNSESFLNNDEYYYLTNNEKEDTSWYVDKNGKISTSDGTDILGIKPVITVKDTIQIKTGDGSKESPYIFEEETSLIGSYVKLDEDIWRIYSEEDNIIKLSLDNYLTVDNEEIKYKYSSDNYNYNSTKYGSLAYYLNRTYLNSLKYKNILEEANFSNGLYNNTNNYNYIQTLNSKVKTKVALLSIGDIILNKENANYFMSTGISKDSNMIYTMQSDFRAYTKVSTTSLKVIPVIAINKESLTGVGTKDSPYEISNEEEKN